MRRLLLALALLLCSVLSQAHPMPGSQVLLSFGPEAVTAELELPLDQLELAFRQSLMDEPESAVERQRGALVAYLAAHVRPVAPDGRAWLVRTEELNVHKSGGMLELHARMRLLPPAKAPLRQFHLLYDVISHELVAHEVLIAAGNDGDRGSLSGTPEPLATLHWGLRELDIDRPAQPWWRSWLSLMQMGMLHIAAGSDHLLFLLVLLLPAPLLVQQGRWQGHGGAHQTLLKLLRIVSAFTLGHSFTLALGASNWLRLPAQPVEVLIAISILVSALHAWRPLFPGRETWIAAGFGLIHGLAFSEVLSGLGLSGSTLAAAVLAFNVGIELMQLLVLVCVVPWLLLLARVPVYTSLRCTAAGGAAVLALAWIAQRSTAWANPLDALVDAMLANSPWRLFALASLVAWGLLIRLNMAGRLDAPGSR